MQTNSAPQARPPKPCQKSLCFGLPFLLHVLRLSPPCVHCVSCVLAWPSLYCMYSAAPPSVHCVLCVLAWPVYLACAHSLRACALWPCTSCTAKYRCLHRSRQKTHSVNIEFARSQVVERHAANIELVFPTIRPYKRKSKFRKLRAENLQGTNCEFKTTQGTNQNDDPEQLEKMLPCLYSIARTLPLMVLLRARNSFFQVPPIVFRC